MGLTPIAELQSSLTESEHIESLTPVLRGVITGLHRDLAIRKDGPLFTLLLQRVAGLFSFSEADLETRIDERPLPSDPGMSDSLAAVQAMVEKSGSRAALLVQSTSTPDGFFVRMPSVIVLEESTSGAAVGRIEQLGGRIVPSSGRRAV